MDIRASDLGLLLALDALLEECHVTRAAERLNISQPAMSAQLARLRDLFQDPLLVSSGRQMVPTPLALELQEPLHKILEQLAQLVREKTPFDLASSTRTFRIIASDYLHQVVTIPMMKTAHELAPDIRFVMLPFDPVTAWKLLEGLDADLLIAWREVTPDDAKALKLYQESLCLAQRKKHPRGSKKPTLDAFCNLEHIIVPPTIGDLQGYVDHELKKLDRKRRVVTSLSSFLLAPELLEKSDLVAVLPRKFALSLNRTLDHFELPFSALKYDIMASWHPRMHHDEGLHWLRGLIVQFLKPKLS